MVEGNRTMLGGNSQPCAGCWKLYWRRYSYRILLVFCDSKLGRSGDRIQLRPYNSWFFFSDIRQRLIGLLIPYMNLTAVKFPRTVSNICQIYHPQNNPDLIMHVDVFFLQIFRNARVDCSRIPSVDLTKFSDCVNGGWSRWSRYTGCFSGLKFRFRFCNSPSPAGCGRPCVGPSFEYSLCNQRRRSRPTQAFIRRVAAEVAPPNFDRSRLYE